MRRRTSNQRMRDKVKRKIRRKKWKELRESLQHLSPKKRAFARSLIRPLIRHHNFVEDFFESRPMTPEEIAKCDEVKMPVKTEDIIPVQPMFAPSGTIKKSHMREDGIRVIEDFELKTVSVVSEDQLVDPRCRMAKEEDSDGK